MPSQPVSQNGMQDNASRVLQVAPADMGANERRVRANFWTKLKRHIGRVPFASDLVAAYYCATDARTPVRVKALLFAALAYFILPADLVPDFILALGFTDDATVIAMALGLVRTHMKQEHYDAARRALDETGGPGDAGKQGK